MERKRKFTKKRTDYIPNLQFKIKKRKRPLCISGSDSDVDEDEYLTKKCKILEKEIIILTNEIKKQEKKSSLKKISRTNTENTKQPYIVIDDEDVGDDIVDAECENDDVVYCGTLIDDYDKLEIESIDKSEVETIDKSESSEEKQTSVSETSDNERKSIKFSQDAFDLFSEIIDEISLEGLDGITFEAFWKRIERVSARPFKVNDYMKEKIWEFIVKTDQIKLYRLEEKRPELEVFDRYDYVDPDLGMIVEPETYPEDIYPFDPIDENDDILGSCSTYDTREDITTIAKENDVSLIDQYENVVLVAGQELRSSALISEATDPNLELNSIQYCMLERIGRSRSHGEITQGKLSLQVVSSDSKTIFYNRKMLQEQHLICKQLFYLKTTHIHQATGSLFHLQKFHKKRKLKMQIVTEQIVEELRKLPNNKMDYKYLKKKFGSSLTLPNLLKTPEFQRFIRTDIWYLYRHLYPDATEQEWKYKDSNNEKRVRAIQLINPKLNVSAVWYGEFYDEYDSDSDSESVSDDNGAHGGFLITESVLKESYDKLFATNRSGITLKHIEDELGTDFYTARAILLALLKRNVVDCFKIDAGRQKTIMYFGRCHSEIRCRTEYMKKTKIAHSVKGDKKDLIKETISFSPKAKKIFTLSDSPKKKINDRIIILQNIQIAAPHSRSQNEQQKQSDEPSDKIETERNTEKASEDKFEKFSQESSGESEKFSQKSSGESEKFSQESSGNFETFSQESDGDFETFSQESNDDLETFSQESGEELNEEETDESLETDIDMLTEEEFEGIASASCVQFKEEETDKIKHFLQTDSEMMSDEEDEDEEFEESFLELDRQFGEQETEPEITSEDQLLGEDLELLSDKEIEDQSHLQFTKTNKKLRGRIRELFAKSRVKSNSLIEKRRKHIESLKQIKSNKPKKPGLSAELNIKAGVTIKNLKHEIILPFAVSNNMDMEIDSPDELDICSEDESTIHPLNISTSHSNEMLEHYNRIKKYSENKKLDTICKPIKTVIEEPDYDIEEIIKAGQMLLNIINNSEEGITEIEDENLNNEEGVSLPVSDSEGENSGAENSGPENFGPENAVAEVPVVEIEDDDDDDDDDYDLVSENASDLVYISSSESETDVDISFENVSDISSSSAEKIFDFDIGSDDASDILFTQSSRNTDNVPMSTEVSPITASKQSSPKLDFNLSDSPISSAQLPEKTYDISSQKVDVNLSDSPISPIQVSQKTYDITLTQAPQKQDVNLSDSPIPSTQSSVKLDVNLNDSPISSKQSSQKVDVDHVSFENILNTSSSSRSSKETDDVSIIFEDTSDILSTSSSDKTDNLDSSFISSPEKTIEGLSSESHADILSIETLEGEDGVKTSDSSSTRSPEKTVCTRLARLEYESDLDILSGQSSMRVNVSDSSYGQLSEDDHSPDLRTGSTQSSEQSYGSPTKFLNVTGYSGIQSPEVVELAEASPSKENKETSNRLLGPDPVLVKCFVDSDNIEIEVLESTTPERYKKLGTLYTPTDVNQTQRFVERANLIINTILREKMITDITTLTGKIQQIEMSEGYLARIDRKSLDKICIALVDGGYIKIIKIILRSNKKIKTENVLCDPRIDANHSGISALIDQLKMKFFIASKRKYDPSDRRYQPFDTQEIQTSVDKLKEMSNIDPGQLVYNRKIGRVYGYCPKFMRMKLLHEFLFYLIYDSPRYNPYSINDLQELVEKNCSNLTAEEVKNFGDVHCLEIGWKMFVPPLPVHKDWSSGWALVCDVLLRLPLSLFLKLYNVVYDIPKLNNYLEDPIKKHILIRNLPGSIRNCLLFHRKYIFAIHETLQRLCLVGLIQFGPQKFKEKDQIFVYLNRRAILYDTSSSDPVERRMRDKIYKRFDYYFEIQKDVNHYWYQLLTISMNTELDEANQIETKKQLGNPAEHISILKAFEYNTPETAIMHDVGYIPGDGCGVGGLDSSLWAHMKRNWMWVKTERNPEEKQKLRRMKKTNDDITPEPKKFDQLKEQQKRKVLKKLDPKQKKRLLKKRVLIEEERLKNLQNIPKKRRRRQKYDIIDSEILKCVGKSHLNWTKEEDDILIICKLVSNFLYRMTKKQMITNINIRNILHKLTTFGLNKTSRACMRRITWLLKTENRAYFRGKAHKHFMSEAPLIKKICEGATNIKALKENPEENLVVTFFEHIVTYFYKNRLNRIKHPLQLKNIDTTDQLTLDKIICYKNKEKTKYIYSNYYDVECVDDIKIDLIKSIIHSSLGCTEEMARTTYQLFNLYQVFSDDMLRDVLQTMRKEQFFVRKLRVPIKEEITLSTPFQFSYNYIFLQVTKYPIICFSQVYQLLVKLKEHTDNNEFNVEPVNQIMEMNEDELGHNAGLAELSSYLKITYDIKMPDEIIILNSSIEDHSEVIKELAVRYHYILSKKLSMRRAGIRRDFGYWNYSDECERRKHSNPVTLIEVVKKPGQTFDSIFESTSEDFDNISSSDMQTIRGLVDEDEQITKIFVDNSSDIEEDFSEYYDEVFDLISGDGLSDSDEIENYVVPSIETIMDGMMEKSPKEARRIPYITHLMHLLSPGLIPELDVDNQWLESLNEHFTMVCPISKVFINENLDDNETVINTLVYHSDRCEEFRKSLESNLVVKENMVDEIDYLTIVEEHGGDMDDLNCAEDLIQFILKNEVLGVTSNTLVERYGRIISNLELQNILDILIASGIILKVGIVCFRFVHCKYINIWLLQQFTFDDDNNSLIQNENHYVYMMPWSRIDGKLNAKIYVVWLSVILSHCISTPSIKFTDLIDRFYYLKPVDIFYILESLEKLGCIELKICVMPEGNTLFLPDKVNVTEHDACYLDDLDEIFVKLLPSAMTRLGCFIEEGNPDLEPNWNILPHILNLPELYTQGLFSSDSNSDSSLSSS